MSVYRRPESKFWWYKINVPGIRPRRVLRGSTGTTDRQTAVAITETIKLAHRKALPGEKLHALINALIGSQKQSGLPINGIAPEYQRIFNVSGKSVSPKTSQDRIRVVARLADWVGKKSPEKKNIEDVDKITASQFAQSLKRTGIKAKTRKNVISELSAVWHVLATVHDVPNPWPGVVPDVDDSVCGKAFSREQEQVLLQAADAAGHDWGPICRVARCTGLRYGDIAGLTGDALDETKMALRLDPSKTARHGISVLAPLPADVFAMLRHEGGPLFPEAFECLPRQMWRYPFAKVLEAAGLGGKGYTFHSWRHTFRTRLSEAGVADDIAKRLGGWTQDRTAARYDHALRLDELRAAVVSAGLG